MLSPCCAPVCGDAPVRGWPLQWRAGGDLLGLHCAEAVGRGIGSDSGGGGGGKFSSIKPRIQSHRGCPWSSCEFLLQCYVDYRNWMTRPPHETRRPKGRRMPLLFQNSLPFPAVRAYGASPVFSGLKARDSGKLKACLNY